MGMAASSTQPSSTRWIGRIGIFAFLKFFFFLVPVLAQPPVPVPCSGPNQGNTCRCDNAIVLCTIDDLDGFVYEMTLYQHAGDGPQPMCPPPEGNNTTSNNPTWFRFPAWCEEIELEVCYGSCLDNPASWGTTLGLQAAVYSGCPATAANAIACDTDVAGCIGTNCREITLSGMTIGNIYYFLVDGCAGSACDVTINVLGACGDPVIEDFTEIDGPTYVCAGGDTVEYYHPRPNGANKLYWYIDGVLVQEQTGGPGRFFKKRWTTPGVYELCFDASQDPCIPVTNDPDPTCIEVVVYDITPEDPEPGYVCPGETYPFNGSNYPPGIHEFEAETEGGCDSTTYLEVFLVPITIDTLGPYYLCEGECVEVGGQEFCDAGFFEVTLAQENEPNCDSILRFQVIVYEGDAGDLDLDSPICPGDTSQLSVTGYEDSTGYSQYIIVADSAGNVVVIFEGDEGEFSYDECGEFTVYSLNFHELSELEPPGVGDNMNDYDCTSGCCDLVQEPLIFADDEAPEFVDPPENKTLVCYLEIDTMDVLTWEDNCMGTDTIVGVETGSANLCEGGTITRTWTVVDICGNSAEHVQTITVPEFPEFVFVNPPDDITIICDSIPTSLPPLIATNEVMGICLKIDTVPGVLTGSANLCGGVLTGTWTHTDTCGRVIVHTQSITVEPTDLADWVSPPANDTVTCDSIPTMGEILVISNGLSGNCGILDSLMPVVSGSADLCGGEIIYNWSYTDICGNDYDYEQVVSVTPVDEAEWVNPPPSKTVTCDSIPTSAPDLSYTNDADGDCEITGVASPVTTGSADLCGGTITNTWTFTDECDRTKTHVQTITVTPVPQAQFVSPPASITVTCANIPTSAPILTYTNGLTGSCAITGSVAPVTTGTADLCGGTITNTWEFTDPCGRVTQHVQVITVTPVPQAQWVSPPASITVDCANIPTSAPDLSFTNGESGACAITGSVPAVVSGSANLCGGTVTFTWTYTDPCGRTITHVQNVTANPVPQAQFVSPPASLTVQCADIPTSAPDLSFTNGLTGDCAITGSVPAVTTGSANLCGGTITNTWTYTDPCGRTITHVQTITAQPVPQANFVSPPASVNVDCYNIPTTAPDLTYTNGLTGACAITGSVPAVQSGSANLCGGTITFTWTFTDACGRTTTHVQNVAVTPVAQAQFVNPPANQNVTCDNIPTTAPELSYSNGETGACAISGSVPAVQSGFANLCGGVIQFTWSFTDQCQRSIQHVQTVIASPVPTASFINPPPSATIQCEEIPSGAPSLNFSNNLSGDCAIVGSVIPTQTGGADLCGGQINYTWTHTDQCGRIIQHVQSLTVIPVPAGQFQNPPPSVTVNCTNIPGTPGNLLITNGKSGDCLISSSVSPVLIGNPDPCGGQFSYRWSFTDQCGRMDEYNQFITVIPTPVAAFQNVPGDITVACTAVNENPPALNYTNNQPGDCGISGSVFPNQTGSFDYCGGTLFNTWTYTDDCNRTIEHVQKVTVLPAPKADFEFKPANITVTCDNVPGPDQELTFTNNLSGNCVIQGSVLPTQSGSFDPCGGLIIYTWSFNDDCGRLITHDQNVTISPAASPVFEDPPVNVTISCSEAEQLDPAPLITYTNYQWGDCENAGTVAASQSGTYDACGGVITYTWVLDACGKPVTHVQTVTIKPAAEPTMENPPADLTLECGQPFPPSEPLFYYNNEQGTCEVIGFADPVISEVNYTQTITWEYISPCNGSKVTKVRTIVAKPVPTMDVVPDTVRICLGNSYNLGGLQIVDVNQAFPTITFHSATPATPANKLTNLNVSPTANTRYYILGTTQYGCTAETSVLVAVDSPVSAGGDGGGFLCHGASGIDLFDYITGNYSTPGTWVDPNNSGIDIFPPTNVSFANAKAGAYTFWYTVPSNGACPADTSVITLNLVPKITITVDNVACQTNLDFYDVSFTVVGFTPTVSDGTLQNLGAGKWKSVSIPVDSALTIIATDPASGCADTLTINPPNCNCPTVPAPVSLGDKEICFGDPTPTLEVTVGPGDKADWYDAPNGGTLLAGNTLTYTPSVTAPGTYIFYVEAVNLQFPECKSFVRTPIILDILNVPVVQNGILKSCDDNGDGLATFTLTQANPQINGNPNNFFDYYPTLADAQNQSNKLPNSYTNTVPGQQAVYCVVTNASGCTSIAQLTLVVFPTIQLNVAVTPESCLGKKDGSATLSSTGGTGLVQYSLDNSNYSSKTNFTGMTPGTYTAFARDTFGCTVSKQFTIADGLEIQILSFTVECSNNGTASDATDDIYTVTFTLGNNQGNAGTFAVTGPGVNKGPYTYGVSHSFTLPANGQSLVLTLADVVKGCPKTQQIGPLNPCSTDCLMQIGSVTKVCNDAGTNADPEDDFYVFTVNATAINPGAPNTFQVFAGGVLVGTFTYGVGGTFNLPADGSNPVLLFVDSEDPQCFASQLAVDLIPCSNTCVLTAKLDSIECDNLGTGNNFLDDVFSFEVTVTGKNTSGSWIVQGSPGQTYSYGTVQPFGPYLIANGPFVLTLVDANDPNCKVELNVTPPPPCSEPCILETANLVIGNCNNNNTGPTGDDDFFNVTFTVTATSGAVTQYIVQWNGQTWGPFNYGSTANVTGLPANGQSIVLTITDAANNQCIKTVTVSQNPCSECKQTAEAGPGFTLDCFIKNAVLQGSAVPPPPIGGLQWTGPNGFTSSIPNPLVSFPGTYVLTVTYPDQCKAIDSTVVQLDPSVPSANAGPDRVLTCKMDSVLLDGSLSSSGPNQIYIWTDVNNNTVGSAKSIYVKKPGTYFLQVIDLAKNCTSPVAQVVVTENKAYPKAPIYADPAELLNCVIDNVLLFTDSQTNVIFLWTQGPISQPGTQIIINQPGLVRLTATDTVNGCVTISELVIEDQTEYPIVNVGTPGTLNCKDTEVTIDASKSQDGASILYQWFDASLTPIPNGNKKTLVVTQVGTYYLVVRDTVNGCENSDTIQIIGDYDFPTAEAGEDELLPCDVFTTGLSGTYTNAGAAPAFTWSSVDGKVLSGGNAIGAQVEGSAWYFFQVLNTENGCASTDSVFVKGNADEPNPEIDIDAITCKGYRDGSIFVHDIVNGQPPYAVTLNGQTSSTGLFAPLGPGTYQLKVVDVNNCTFDTTITLLEGIELLVTLSAKSILILEGDSAIVEAIVNIPPSEIGEVIWTPGTFLSCDSCLITKVIPLNTQQYQVTVTDKSGCSATDYLLVVVKKESRVFIPNVFSPDDDIINDRFTLFGDSKVKAIRLMRIYDRWGGMMFEASDIPPNDPQYGWDGRVKGMPVDPAVFVYYFEVEFTDGRIEEFKGDVNVVTKQK